MMLHIFLVDIRIECNSIITVNVIKHQLNITCAPET